MTDEPEGGTGAWLQSRTDEQLHELLRTHSGSSPVVQLAFAELQRRDDKRSEHRQLTWIKLTFWTTLLLGIAGIAVALLR